MKKGFSLVEIIISVGLIAVVMLFLFQILTDLQYEESNTNYASSNQLNRANVIQKVEEDFNTRFVKRIKLQNNGDGTSTVLFTFQENSSSTLTVTPTTISYKNGSLPEGKNTFTYKINDNNFQYSNDIKITSDLVAGEANYVNLFCEEEDGNCGTSQFHYVKIRIPVINIKEEENNIQDDIELFYVGPFVEYANKYKKYTLEINNTNSFIKVNRTETKREEEVDLGELQNGANVYEQDKLMISVSPATGYENPKIFLNGEEFASGEYRVKDNEPGGIVSLSSTASLKEFGISLSGNNELPVIITRTSSNKDGASIGTINSTDKIYYGDKLKINFDSYDTAKYQNPILKINNRNYTPENEIVVDSAVIINRTATIREYNQTIQTRFQKADGTWEAYKTAATIKKKYGETVSYSVAQTDTYAAASITSYTVTGTKTVKLDIPRRTSTNIIQVRYQNANGTYGGYSNVVNGIYRVGQTISWSRDKDATYNAGNTSFTATASNQTKQISITRRTYALTVNKGTGIQSVNGGGTYRAGQSVTISATASSGYKFSSWSKNAGTIANANAASTTFTMPTSAATVTANAIVDKYTITYNANGGSGSMANQTVTSGNTVTLTANAFPHDRKVFGGWATSSGGAVAYKNKASVKPTSNLTLYAVWKDYEMHMEGTSLIVESKYVINARYTTFGGGGCGDHHERYSARMGLIYGGFTAGMHKLTLDGNVHYLVAGDKYLWSRSGYNSKHLQKTYYMPGISSEPSDTNITFSGSGSGYLRQISFSTGAENTAVKYCTGSSASTCIQVASKYSYTHNITELSCNHNDLRSSTPRYCDLLVSFRGVLENYDTSKGYPTGIGLHLDEVAEEGGGPGSDGGTNACCVTTLHRNLSLS